MTQETLNILGLIANIVGTILLAFSLSAYIRSMRLAIDAHELYILSTNHRTRPSIQVTGTDVHMNRDRKKSGIFLRLGIILVVGGFLCQLTSFLI